MSMPFMWGAGPSSLTVPVILPSPAALTVCVEIKAAHPINTISDSITAELRRFLIEVLLKELLAEPGCMPQPLLLRYRSIGIDRLQGKLFRHFFFFALLSHKRSQIENQVPCFIGLDIVGKRRHGSAVQAGHEDPVDILIAIATLWP